MNQIKIARLVSGLSQIEVCFRAKIKRYRLSNIERGRTQPTNNEFLRLKELFESIPDSKGVLSND